jgi:hypothetical protein
MNPEQEKALFETMLFLCEQNEMRIQEIVGLRLILIQKGLTTHEEIEEIQKVVEQGHVLAMQRRRLERLTGEHNSDDAVQ